ncbi:MAG: hypothetical protein AB9861_10040 [Methanosarcina sp.]
MIYSRAREEIFLFSCLCCESLDRPANQIKSDPKADNAIKRDRY